MRACRGRSAERGSVLCIAILILLVVTIAGVALMFNTSLENALSGNATRISRAFYAADSGIQYAAGRLANDVNYVGGDVPGGVSSNTPGQAVTGDTTVTVSTPILLRCEKTEGEEVGGPVCTALFFVSATASSKVSSAATSSYIDASKTINTQISVYPHVRSSVWD